MSQIKIIGVQPKSMHAMIESVKKKRIISVKTEKSFAEKLAVNLNPTTITFDIINKNIDYFITSTAEVKFLR